MAAASMTVSCASSLSNCASVNNASTSPDACSSTNLENPAITALAIDFIDPDRSSRNHTCDGCSADDATARPFDDGCGATTYPCTAAASDSYSLRPTRS